MEKLCPYNVHIQQLNLNTYVRDENGNALTHEHKLVENQKPTLCIGRKCGAYGIFGCKYRRR